MIKELRDWLKEDEENVIVNRSGHEQDLTIWYTEFGIEKIWIAHDKSEHELNCVTVQLPVSRARLIEFLLVGLDHSEECEYKDKLDVLHVSFDG